MSLKHFSCFFILLIYDPCFLGVFPYDYARTVNQLRRKSSLPSKKSFFNRLTDQEISDADYNHAKKVFRKFGCQNLMEYYKLYMKLDVALLAEVFFSFRRTMKTHFKLDPCHFISLPSYGFNCMLLMTGVTIEAISDYEVLTFLKTNIRGGFSFVNTRKSVPQGDERLLYLDANNL